MNDSFQHDEFPADDAPPPPGEAPPKWPKALGIVSIAIAVFGLLCGGLGLAVAPVMGGMMESQLGGAPLPDAWKVGPVDLALGIAGLLLSVVLLFAGITLLARSPTGRLLHLVYAIPAIPLNIYAYINSLNKQASLEQWAVDHPDNPIAQGINSQDPAQAAGQLFGEICGMTMFLGLGVLFPLFLFVWFVAIKVRPEQITGTQDGVY